VQVGDDLVGEFAAVGGAEGGERFDLGWVLVGREGGKEGDGRWAFS
jgi:hypothetical protein